jgi:formate dehydrogenase
MAQDADTAAPPRKRLRPRPKGRAVDPKARAEVQALLGDAPRRRDLLIEHLHAIQDRYGCLTAAHLTALAAEMRLAPTEVYEVATFYHHFDVIKEGQRAPPTLTVRVCESLTCEMFGARELIAELRSDLEPGVRVQPVPCVGRCERAPVAVVGWNPMERATSDGVAHAVSINAVRPSYLPEHPDLESYRRQGGYQTYLRVARGELGAESVISELTDAGLRGLGGAGFPVGRKWRTVKDYPAPRLMAVNIDEGEPGTFKDRFYLESDPHRFLEGMLIAAKVVGIDEVYLYVRDEYPQCREMLAAEIQALRSAGLGELPALHLRRGAGAYICGEESAMIESIEGKRGLPRLRPPYVAEVGLFDRPTLEHNLESLYWVRDILERGAAWFTSEGRHGRKGLRSFSVSGRINNPGVHLAPAGISLRELVDEYCGGMSPGHELYGYFPGGASGGILPASLADEPLDFDTLQVHGCFIGSAAVIVFSRQDSARALALNAMRFFAHESCGQCTPCRVGTQKAVKLMEQRSWDEPLLKELSQVMTDASICGLGQAAPNPLLCALKYFPEEFH